MASSKTQVYVSDKNTQFYCASTATLCYTNNINRCDESITPTIIANNSHRRQTRLVINVPHMHVKAPTHHNDSAVMMFCNQAVCVCVCVCVCLCVCVRAHLLIGSTTGCYGWLSVLWLTTRTIGFRTKVGNPLDHTCTGSLLQCFPNITCAK